MQQKMDRPVETRTITESATISLEFVIQEGSKGHYKIVRDGVTIIDKEVPYQLNNSESLLIIIACYAVYKVDGIAGKNIYIQKLVT